MTLMITIEEAQTISGAGINRYLSAGRETGGGSAGK
jgi:hypothetical protein